jgi:hypothetical protein
MSENKRPHRATIYQDAGGRWRYRVLAGNNRTVDAPEQSFKRRGTALRRVTKRWPDAVVTIEAPQP